MWVPALLLLVAAGWLLARVAAPAVFRAASPDLRIPGEFALGTLFGLGLGSVAFFALLLVNAAGATVCWATLAALAAVSGALFWNFQDRRTTADQAQPRRFPWTWALLVGLVLACALLFADYSAALQANPGGEWDATAIWNLRAKFLAGGSGLWRRALSAEPGVFMATGSHPGYPLCLSGAIALLWTIAGSYAASVPSALSLLIAAALLAFSVATLGARRSTATGLLGGLILAGTELFASQLGSQYSDLLLALAFLAAIVCLDAASREASPEKRVLLAAGLALGFAPWIKNEGVPFAAATIAIALWRFRATALWTLAGAIPGIAATLVLKSLAGGRESMFPNSASEVFTKLSDPFRSWQVLLGFADAVWQLGPWWAHPVLLVALLAWALGWEPGAGRRWLAIPLAVTFAAEFGILVLTRAEFSWHIQTSVTRLILQLWPAALWLVMIRLRMPAEYFAPVPEFVPAAAAPAKKRAAQK